MSNESRAIKLDYKTPTIVRNMQCLSDKLAVYKIGYRREKYVPTDMIVILFICAVIMSPLLFVRGKALSGYQKEWWQRVDSNH